MRHSGLSASAELLVIRQSGSAANAGDNPLEINSPEIIPPNCNPGEEPPDDVHTPEITPSG